MFYIHCKLTSYKSIIEFLMRFANNRCEALVITQITNTARITEMLTDSVSNKSKKLE